MGALGLLVNRRIGLVALLALLCLMRWMGLGLQPSTAMVFSVALGMAVDDTIHFLAAYRQRRKRGLSADRAVVETISLRMALFDKKEHKKEKDRSSPQTTHKTIRRAMRREMLSYLAGVAAYMEAGGPAASQRPTTEQSQRQSATRAHSSRSSQPEQSVVISFSNDALEAAKERSLSDNLVEVELQATHRGQEDQREQAAVDGSLPGQDELSADELQTLRELERRDLQVRTQDMAFIAAAGGAAGSYSLQYETGPDGRRYATGADIKLDTSEGATPEQTLAKARALRSAAMGGRSSSSTHATAAAKAVRMETEARAEIERARAAESQGLVDDNAKTPHTLPEVELPELDVGPSEPVE